VSFGDVVAVSQDALDALKAYLRVTHTDDDVLLGTLLDMAHADVESYLGVPVVAAERTYSVSVGRNEGYLSVPGPISPDGITITDPDGYEWDAGVFTINAPAGLLSTGGSLAGRSLLTPGTWEVTCTAGLSLRPDYESVLAPVVDMSVMMRAADLYLNRNVRAASERDGDTSIALGGEVERIAAQTGLARYRRFV
jgi:hypothetical protein